MFGFLGLIIKRITPLKITGYKLCKNIHYIDRFHEYSSSVIRKKIYEAEKYKEDIQEFIKEEANV